MVQIKLFIFCLISIVFLQVNVSAAKKDSTLSVGDYLIAQISSQANDYNAANIYYLNLLKKDKKNINLYLKIIKNNLLNNKIEEANKYYIKLKKIGCNNSNLECINFLESIGPLVNGIVDLKNNRNNKALKAFSKIRNFEEN